MKNHWIFAYLRLMRPANIITAIADICLGFAASGSVIHLGVLHYKTQNIEYLFWLVLATSGLYGGGVVLNDYFDYELDQKERPERPLPSGKASLQGALIFGLFLLILGVLAAWQVSMLSAVIAICIVVLVILYDSISKHSVFFGPLNMGMCRGANLLLGVSAIEGSLVQVWIIALIPIVYIAAITLISQGEVNGGNRRNLYIAFMFYTLTFLSILSLGFLLPYHFVHTLPFVALWLYLVLPPLLEAFDLQAKHIFKAVKAGVLALIVLDASIAAGFAGWEYGLIVLLLLPISLNLAKIFSVS